MEISEQLRILRKRFGGFWCVESIRAKEVCIDRLHLIQSQLIMWHAANSAGASQFTAKLLLIQVQLHVNCARHSISDGRSRIIRNPDDACDISHPIVSPYGSVLLPHAPRRCAVTDSVRSVSVSDASLLLRTCERACRVRMFCHASSLVCARVSQPHAN